MAAAARSPGAEGKVGEKEGRVLNTRPRPSDRSDAPRDLANRANACHWWPPAFAHTSFYPFPLSLALPPTAPYRDFHQGQLLPIEFQVRNAWGRTAVGVPLHGQRGRHIRHRRPSRGLGVGIGHDLEEEVGMPDPIIRLSVGGSVLGLELFFLSGRRNGLQGRGSGSRCN